jgi:hypothetical protein
LDVAYRYNSVDEIRNFLAFLHVDLIEHTEQPLQPQPGIAYRGDEFAKFHSLIPGTKWVEQPGHCYISGHHVFAWCEGNKVKISVGGDYVIIESDVLRAEAIEKVLVGAPLHRVDPPVDSKNCICPKYYPQYFS